MTSEAKSDEPDSYTIKEFRARNRISERTWKRLRAAHDIPRLTHITAHKTIIRREHAEAWLAARTDPARGEPSPFPTDDAALLEVGRSPAEKGARS
jgi:hypothetical protein